MEREELKALCDFEWASVARYLIYVSEVAGLKEVSFNDVNSFLLARLGPEKLLKRKRRALAVLLGNIAALERFAGNYEGKVGSDELAVIRGIYIQYKNSVAIVERHIAVTLSFAEMVSRDLFEEDGEDEEDQLF